MDILLSIVIPSFNAGHYIHDCLRSIFSAKSFSRDIEVIVVDDGSFDSSIEKVMSLFQRRIESGVLRVIRQNNAGVSAARNVGVAASSGRYISFVDSDDCIDPEYFVQVRDALNHKPDMIFFNMRRFGDGRNSIINLHNKDGFVDGEDARFQAFLLGAWYNCLRVFDINLFQNIEFPEGQVFEDVRTIPLLYAPGVKVFYISSPIYLYRINYSGISASVDSSYISGLLDFYKGVNWCTQECSVLYRLQILRLLLNFSIIKRDSKYMFAFVCSELKLIRVPFRFFFKSKFVRFGVFPRSYYFFLIAKKKIAINIRKKFGV